jgi:hypothetical protein
VAVDDQNTEPAWGWLLAGALHERNMLPRSPARIGVFASLTPPGTQLNVCVRVEVERTAPQLTARDLGGSDSPDDR